MTVSAVGPGSRLVDTITVHRSTNSDYVSEFGAGLFELAASGSVNLRFSAGPPRRAAGTDFVLFRMEVDVDGLERAMRVCFDSADWRDIASMDDLAAADIYFKRSYHAPFIDGLAKPLRDKIVPLGLHYGCSSRAESLSQCFQSALVRSSEGSLGRDRVAALARPLVNPVKLLLKRSGLLALPSMPPFIDEFEVAPERPAEQAIFYRTRVYGPTDAPDNFRQGRMAEVNDLRADTVRALKAHFGNRFVGGLRPSAFARETYPDCVFPNDPGLRGHLELSKACLINVNTAGLHDSTSWKIPEYMAGSRCIVSEPMLYETPVPLREGKHYLAFRCVDECVAACAKLLADPDLAQAMRHDNFAFYTEHIRPNRLMSNCIEAVRRRSHEIQA